ncbi:unnamed protein product [Caenorhabditis bovis]|uniref:Uncharacterized protein n=1 Tax=Caenorhabditis bovis TaxID=2654633 RepID=A0A8S1FD25_9PELO|nr:unnamed protein product [Caenorhabditis bovis]
MARIHRECRERSLPAVRFSKPLDYFSDISDWCTSSKKYYNHHRDIVRDNIRVIKSSGPRIVPIRTVPPFCRQVYQQNTSVVPLPKMMTRSRSTDPNVVDDATQFRNMFTRGDLHVRIIHSGGPGEKPRELQWAKDPSQMKNETICALISKFSLGLSLLDHPYRFVAETGITDLLIALRNQMSLISVLPHLVRGIRAGLYSFDVEKKKFCLRTLSRVTSLPGIGPQLVPFYRQLLPPLRSVGHSRSRSDRVHYNRGRQIEEMITSTLNDLERTGGPNALINIKYLLPNYESCKYMILVVYYSIFACSLAGARPQDHEPIPIPKDSSTRPQLYRHVPSDPPAPSNLKPRRRHRHRHHYTPEYEKQLQEYEIQKKLAERQRQRQYDQYYQNYFDRMRAYAMNVHINRYRQILQQQELEKERFAKNMEEYGLRSDELAAVEQAKANIRGEHEETQKPASPFEGISEKSQIEQRSIKAESAMPVMVKRPPSAIEPRPENIDVHRKALHLESLCHRFLPTVRKHCNTGEKTEKKYASKCKGYFHDCQRFLPKEDPLYNIAYAFNSNVGLNLGTWDVKGIPYYPINEEGAIGAGRQMNIPFGSWGGGYSDHIGVRDYWSQYQEIGANWYEGKYGYKRHSCGGKRHFNRLNYCMIAIFSVSVPLKPGDAGKPIGVDVGGGVGPYYQQNQHVGVDPLNGQVNTNFGVGVPMAGVGVNTGVGVNFPGVNDILGR